MSADPAGFALINPMGEDGKPRAGYSPVEATNWYAYTSNNPVKYVDLTGEEARDLFDSREEAMIDFAETYNDDAINNDREYGTMIYKTSDGQYYYSKPREGGPHSVNPRTPKRFLRRDEVDSYTHTHGAESEGYDDERFSFFGDISFAESEGKPLGLVTPGGSVQVYDPENDSTTIIDAPNVPSDPKSGSDRVTTVHPSTGEDSPYR